MVIKSNYDESRTKKAQRESILKNSYELFLISGIADVTMQDIAKKCDIDRRSLYNYYSSKDEIATEIMKIWYGQMKQVVQPSSMHGETGFEIVKNLLYDFCDYLNNNADAILYTVYFDHYFKNDYKDSKFEIFVMDYFYSMTTSDENLAKFYDGTIRAEYIEDFALTITTLSNTILAMAQRIFFRREILEAEQKNADKQIPLLVEMLLNGIKSE